MDHPSSKRALPSFYEQRSQRVSFVTPTNKHEKIKTYDQVEHISRLVSSVNVTQSTPLHDKSSSSVSLASRCTESTHNLSVSLQEQVYRQDNVLDALLMFHLPRTVHDGLERVDRGMSAKTVSREGRLVEERFLALSEAAVTKRAVSSEPPDHQLYPLQQAYGTPRGSSGSPVA